jgi:hypothetical protein
MPSSKGELFDELLSNNSRLVIAHICLGLAMSFVFWIRPGTFNPFIRPHGAYGYVVRITLFTAIAWIPFAISAKFSRSVLSSRNPKASCLFICCAIVITVIGCGFYLNLFSPRLVLQPFATAAAVTVGLIAAAGICAAIWRDDMPS